MLQACRTGHLLLKLSCWMLNFSLFASLGTAPIVNIGIYNLPVSVKMTEFMFAFEKFF